MNRLGYLVVTLVLSVALVSLPYSPMGKKESAFACYVPCEAPVILPAIMPLLAPPATLAVAKLGTHPTNTANAWIRTLTQVIQKTMAVEQTIQFMIEFYLFTQTLASMKYGPGIWQAMNGVFGAVGMATSLASQGISSYNMVSQQFLPPSAQMSPATSQALQLDSQYFQMASGMTANLGNTIYAITQQNSRNGFMDAANGMQLATQGIATTAQGIQDMIQLHLQHQQNTASRWYMAYSHAEMGKKSNQVLYSAPCIDNMSHFYNNSASGVFSGLSGASLENWDWNATTSNCASSAERANPTVLNTRSVPNPGTGTTPSIPGLPSSGIGVSPFSATLPMPSSVPPSGTSAPTTSSALPSSTTAGPSGLTPGAAASMGSTGNTVYGTPPPVSPPPPSPSSSKGPAS
ncbi:MAG: hypothetical protein ACYDBP_04395 [Leptospirales bacterium]